MPAMQSPQGARAQGGKDACLRRDCMAHKGMPAQETGRTPRTHSTRPTTNNGQSGGVHHSSPKRVRRVGCQVGFAHIPQAPGRECEREEDDGCDQQHGSVLDVKGFLDVPPPGRNATRAAVNLPADQSDQQHLGPHLLLGDLRSRVNYRPALWMPRPALIWQTTPMNIRIDVLAVHGTGELSLQVRAKLVSKALAGRMSLAQVPYARSAAGGPFGLLATRQGVEDVDQFLHDRILPAGNLLSIPTGHLLPGNHCVQSRDG